MINELPNDLINKIRDYVLSTNSANSANPFDSFINKAKAAIISKKNNENNRDFQKKLNNPKENIEKVKTNFGDIKMSFFKDKKVKKLKDVILSILSYEHFGNELNIFTETDDFLSDNIDNINYKHGSDYNDEAQTQIQAQSQLTFESEFYPQGYKITKASQELWENSWNALNIKYIIQDDDLQLESIIKKTDRFITNTEIQIQIQKFYNDWKTKYTSYIEKREKITVSDVIEIIKELPLVYKIIIGY